MTKKKLIAGIVSGSKLPPLLQIQPPKIPLQQYAAITSGDCFRTPDHAIWWLRDAADDGHMPSCLCVRCSLARQVTRAAVRAAECECGQCRLCWADRQIKGGRI